MSGRPGVSDLRVGDIVRLKKAHPCGGFLWLVNRIGGDIGLRCETCGHYVMIPRFRIERRIREIARPAWDGIGSEGQETPPHPSPLPRGERGLLDGEADAGGPKQ